VQYQKRTLLPAPSRFCTEPGGKSKIFVAFSVVRCPQLVGRVVATRYGVQQIEGGW
jgi:hypothetical protein